MKRKWKSFLRKAFKAINRYIRRNPAVVYGWITVITTFLVRRYPDLPSDLVALTILSLFGLSKTVQKVEDKKTQEALCGNLPKEEYGKTPRQNSRKTRTKKSRNA